MMGKVASVERLVAPSRRARQRAERRARLLDAARICFAARGFGQTTVAHVTSAADVGHGTFYSYFANKDDLLLALIDDSLAELGPCLRRPRDDAAGQVGPAGPGQDVVADGAASLRPSILALLGWFERHRAVLLALREAVVRDPAVVRAWLPAEAELEQWALAHIAWGERRGAAPMPDRRAAAQLTRRLVVAVAYDVALAEPVGEAKEPRNAEAAAAAVATYCARALFSR